MQAFIEIPSYDAYAVLSDVLFFVILPGNHLTRGELYLAVPPAALSRKLVSLARFGKIPVALQGCYRNANRFILRQPAEEAKLDDFAARSRDSSRDGASSTATDSPSRLATGLSESRTEGLRAIDSHPYVICT